MRAPAIAANLPVLLFDYGAFARRVPLRLVIVRWQLILLCPPKNQALVGGQ